MNTIRRTYVFNQGIVKHTLPTTTTKFGEVQFSIWCLLLVLDCKAYGCYLVPFPKRIPIFDECVLSWGSKKKHHKDTCPKEIGLRLHHGFANTTQVSTGLIAIRISWRTWKNELNDSHVPHAHYWSPIHIHLWTLQYSKFSVRESVIFVTLFCSIGRQ